MVKAEKTIEFSFTQIHNKIDNKINNKIDNKIDRVLVAKNPFPKNIKYHLKTMDLKGNIDKISRCPVKANAWLSEQWDHLVLDLLLTDMHFLEANDVMSCDY